MRYTNLLSDDAVARELGARLERARLARNATQEELAEQAGIGRATLQRLERGDAVQLGSVIKVLRALDLLDALEAVVPEEARSPLDELDRRGRPARRRATGRRAVTRAEAAAPAPWRWPALTDDDPPEDR
jgi:transcriptional regulator with XRE-family HTH domain